MENNYLKFIKKIIFVFFIILLFNFNVYAWEDHAQITYFSLNNNNYNFLDEQIEVKTFSLFIVKNLEQIINFFEYFNNLISKYEDLKDLKINFKIDEFVKYLNENCNLNLKFNNYKEFANILEKEAAKNKEVEKSIVKYFLYKLKINPEYNIKYFIKKYMLNGYKNSYEDKEISFNDIAYVYYLNTFHKFYEIKPGYKVKALEVLSTASDEPDYGLDIGLFEDNKTSWGKEFGFGYQPFGNPEVPYGTQAPFHMGFFHESKILYKLMPDLKKSYVIYRIILFTELSKVALKLNEKYWGYRFAGWALHYIMDMGQPYHSSVVPGSSSFYLIFVGILGKLGIKGPQNSLLNDITYKHTLLEMMQAYYLNTNLINNSYQDLLQKSVFKSINEAKVIDNFNYNIIIDKISKDAKYDGKKTYNVLKKLIKNKEKYKNILKYSEDENFDLFEIIYKEEDKRYKEFEKHLAFLLGKVSTYIKTYLKYINEF
jgi:hypothetical protein